MNKKEYDKKVQEEASKINLNAEDLHNLYDLMYTYDYGRIKDMKFMEWYNDFFHKIQKIVVPELEKG